MDRLPFCCAFWFFPSYILTGCRKLKLNVCQEIQMTMWEKQKRIYTKVTASKVPKSNSDNIGIWAVWDVGLGLGSHNCICLWNLDISLVPTISLCDRLRNWHFNCKKGCFWKWYKFALLAVVSAPSILLLYQIKFQCQEIMILNCTHLKHPGNIPGL